MNKKKLYAFMMSCWLFMVFSAFWLTAAPGTTLKCKDFFSDCTENGCSEGPNGFYAINCSIVGCDSVVSGSLVCDKKSSGGGGSGPGTGAGHSDNNPCGTAWFWDCHSWW